MNRLRSILTLITLLGLGFNAYSTETSAASSVIAKPILLPQAQFEQLRAQALQAALESYKSLALHSVVQVSFINENRPTDKQMIVLINNVTQDKPPIKAFGRDVVYLSRDQIREQQIINFIEVKRIAVLDATHAEVGIIYPYRDVSGQIALTLIDNKWAINKDRVVLGIANAQYYMMQLFEGITCHDDTEYSGWKNRVQGIADDKCRDTHGKLLHSIASQTQ